MTDQQRADLIAMRKRIIADIGEYQTNHPWMETLMDIDALLAGRPSVLSVEEVLEIEV